MATSTKTDRRTHALDDRTIKAAKPEQSRLTDGKALYLDLNWKGGFHTWRFDYKRPNGKRNTLTFGAYPAVSIARARHLAQEVRSVLAGGVDPADLRDKVKDEREEAVKLERIRSTGGPLPGTFRAVALAFIAKNFQEKPQGGFINKWSPSHADRFTATMRKYVFPAFGEKPMADIRVASITPVIETLQRLGFHATAASAKKFIVQVFNHANALELCDYNPVNALKAAVNDEHVGGNQPAVKTPIEARELIKAIDDMDDETRVRECLLMCLYTAQRPGNVAAMEWAHVNLDAGTWVIPGDMMKAKQKVKAKAAATGKTHTVYLSAQAVAVLAKVKAQNLPGKFVFPHGVFRLNAERSIARTMLQAALWRAGFKDRHTAHGFRAMFRTIGEEVLGLDGNVLEATLAHANGEALGTAYFRAEFASKRQEAAQAWGTYCDKLRTGEALAPVLKLAA